MGLLFAIVQLTLVFLYFSKTMLHHVCITIIGAIFLVNYSVQLSLMYISALVKGVYSVYTVAILLYLYFCLVAFLFII